jgi:hypothetical protein
LDRDGDKLTDGGTLPIGLALDLSSSMDVSQQARKLDRVFNQTDSGGSEQTKSTDREHWVTASGVYEPGHEARQIVFLLGHEQ